MLVLKIGVKTAMRNDGSLAAVRSPLQIAVFGNAGFIQELDG